MLEAFTKDAPSFDPRDVEASKTIAGVSYIGILFFLPLITHPASAFGRYNANQALLLFICGALTSAVTGVIRAVLGWVPVLGVLVTILLSLVGLAYLIVMLICLVLTLQGTAIRIPVIGGITLIK